MSLQANQNYNKYKIEYTFYLYSKKAVIIPNYGQMFVCSFYNPLH